MPNPGSRHQTPKLPHATIDPSSAGGRERVTYLGVDYIHQSTSDGGEIYLTRLGLRFHEHLQPENWHSPEWFSKQRRRLLGTSTICRMPTRKVDGRSLQLVVRHSRVGETVPLDTQARALHCNAEFNTPFEEFSLVFELREGLYGPPELHIRLKHPLAIYVPPERVAQWQSGRSLDKIAVKQARQPEVPLELERQYVLLYGWIKGQDAEQIADEYRMPEEERFGFLEAVNERADRELGLKGFTIPDIKPAHIILRRDRHGRLLRRHDERIAYAVVDYELLTRTPTYERWLRERQLLQPRNAPQDSPETCLSPPSELPVCS